jgi:hypothetical protein
MMHKEEMEESKMKGMMEWWKALPEDKKKAVMKAKLEMKIKMVQSKLDLLKEIQKILG